MNKKTQRVVSIVIGLILASLLLYIGWRIVQRRQSRASTPAELSCKVQGSNGVVTWQDSNAEIEIMAYGTVSGASYPFLCEEENTPEPADGGMYAHQCIIGPLVSGSQYAVSIGEITMDCAGDTVVGEPAINETEVKPTVILQPIRGAEVTPEAEVAEPSVLLPENEVEAYFEDNPEASMGDCVAHFAPKNYSGLGQMCSEAWAKINL